MPEIEEWIHHWWMKKNIDIRKIKTSGYQLEILDFGEYNAYESGPDFIHAKIRIDDLIWCGAVEIHLRSSDWNRHGHHEDINYNNVILHVVEKKDIEVYNQRGEQVLTVEIAPYHDSVLRNFQFIPCENRFSTCDSLTIIHELEHSFIDRMNRKTALIQFHEMIYSFDYQAIYWLLFFKSFGNKVNQYAFEELFLAVYPYLRKERQGLQVMLLGMSGFLQEEDAQYSQWEHLQLKHSISMVKTIHWKTKGFYASSSPERRIVQLAKLFPLFQNIDWMQMATEDWLQVKNKLVKDELLSKMQMDLLLINSVALFYWWFSTQTNDSIYRERAIDLLMALPAEKNKMMQHWKNIGFSPKNAMDSQALLELKNQKCNFTRCLTCKIGQKIYEFPETRDKKTNCQDQFFL